MFQFLRRHRFWILGLALLAPCLWLASAHGVRAQVTANELLPGQVGNVIGTGTADIRVTIARIIRVALGFLGTIALLLVLYAGFLWMTASGDESKIQRAKQTLTAALIGLAIILSAFAIVSFILNALVAATTGGDAGGPGGGGGGGGGLGGSGGSFRVVSILPDGSKPLAKRDVVASINFSGAPTSDTANIKSNISYVKVVGSARTPVSYDPIVENDTIRLQPTDLCPAPNDAKHCLEAGQNYEITVSSGLKDAASSSTVSCGLNACKRSFVTGDAVATGLPTVAMTLPSDGSSVPAGDLISLFSTATDANGIATVEYSADGQYLASDGSAVFSPPTNYSSQSFWDTKGVTPVKTVALTARAVNIDGDSVSSAPVNVTVRPGFCFNHVKDGDEVAVDCGGSCGACTGASCTNNASCSSGQCQGGVCVQNPVITSVDAGGIPLKPAGKPGNMVTIYGSNFGSTTGTVTFLGGAATGDEKDAALASCSGAWSDTRIVVVVPAGAATGAIQVSLPGGAKKDATNDAVGPHLDDFIINDVAAPGICGIAPASVKIGQSMTVSGLAFGPAQADSTVQLSRTSFDCTLQDWSAPSTASQVSPWSDVSVQPTMPNLDTGLDGANYLMRLVVGGHPSNSACVRAEPPSAGTDPHIDFVSPTSGSVGTYVTIFGSSLGGGGTVRFKNAAGEAIGDVTFPAQCAANYWTDSSVTVKVPAMFTTPASTVIQIGSYDLTVVRSDGRASNTSAFAVNTAPVPPGVCRIDPDNGPVGTPVSLYGEGFGDVDQSAIATLKPDAVTFHDAKNASVGQWQNTTIKAVAPAGAVTGAVVVKKYSGAASTSSNGINFQVSDCRQTGGDSSCGSGRSCCDDGACRASCGALASAGGFAWQFATGPIPIYPVVIENATCQLAAPVTTPSPNPYKGAQDVCTDMGAMSLRFSLPMDAATLNSSNIKLEACGNGAALDATHCSAFGGAGTVNTYQSDPGSKMQFSVSGLQASTWYRLTLSGDRILSTDASDRSAQPLDGNFDGKPGGDYVTTFKTGASPCVLAGAQVTPADGLIDDANVPLGYDVAPLSDRCIILECVGRSVSWSSSDISKATLAPASSIGQCDALASPVSETDPGPPIHVTGTVDTKSDKGDLTINYANPVVVDYGPRDCTEACVNTVAFAYFNTPMSVSADPHGNDVSVVSVNNLKLQKCQNESCLAFAGDVQPLAAQYIPSAKLLTFGNPQLDPNTFYRVTISGKVASTSQAPLSGLNYNGDSFSWIFRTRTDGNPCGPQKVTIDPPQTTLQYISQVAPVTALPLTSPDKCSAKGEILGSSSFNWAWSKDQKPAAPPAFHYLPDNGTGALLNTNPNLPPGCSSSCLMTGSKPPGTPLCGNGVVEKGEECDTVPPGLNGCNQNCLLAGNTDKSSCGNGAVEPNKGEECDAGAANGTPASGCSTTCMLTGSSTGASVCGNGSKGVGEACDDGNTESGDGCSSNCLLEGSQQNVYVCGNGKIEPGEECDYTLASPSVASSILLPNHAPIPLPASGVERNPAKPGFACSPSCLLKGNPVSCLSGLDCCGNGVIEPADGEGCDAGPNNGQPGYGCSNTCTKTGSSPDLRAFCGDAKVVVKAADTVAQNGGGEECEAAAPDANIDPVQVVEALNQCDAGNSCTASVSAKVGNVTGQGGVSVQCSCHSDGDCSAFGAAAGLELSCGAGSCCYPRPALPDIKPKGGQECRNAQISVTFGEEMDLGSLEGNLIVEDCGAVAVRDGGGSWLARLGKSFGDFLLSLVGRRASAASCTAISGKFTSVKDVTPAAVKTVSTFAPNQLFDPKHAYRVTVKGGPGGVKNAKGVGYSASNPPAPQEFTTSPDICSFDLVQMDPAEELIQKSSDPLTILATAMTNHGGLLQPIAPVPGSYDWTWSWATVPEATPPGSILKLTAAAAPSAIVQAVQGINGQEQVLASAKITADTNFNTLGQQKVGKSEITVMLCEQPWPERDTLTGAWAPYVDAATHYEFFYCRDNGNTPLPELQASPVQGQSGQSGNLLRFCQPALSTPATTLQPKSCFTNADCGSGETCQSKDLFFQFKPETKLNDAIGVRVYSNPGRLTAQDWYQSQHFSGSTQAVTVDGYGAIKDSRTVYIASVDKYGDPELRPYVYVFAFNDKAASTTSLIFDQLIKNIRLNTNLTPPDRVVDVCKVGDNLVSTAGSSAPVTCSSDLDCFNAITAPPAGLYCDSDKDKIRRDLRRWQDISALQTALEQAHSSTGFYPKLESGSFVRGFTTSKWPSWAQQMGSAGSIVDPLNGFNRCDAFGSECSISGTACANDGECKGGTGDVCRARFEAATCYDDRAGVFACPAASHVYQYRAIGGVDYRVSVDFEYTKYKWTDSDCSAHVSEASCRSGAGCSWQSTGPTTGSCLTRISIAPVCSGLFTDATNKCLATGAACADSSSCGASDHCVPTSVPLIGPAASATCGNGLLEGTEECEIGQKRNVSCASGAVDSESCDASCHWKVDQACPGANPDHCGNGSIETFFGESCDDGAQTGQYGRCRLGGLGCAKHCVNISPRPKFSAGDVGSAICVSNADCGLQSVCTDRMNFCGDGVKNGPEACDDGANNGQYGYCSWDCRGPGPRCGDSVTNGSEQCDGTHDESGGVCVPTASSATDASTVSGASKACANDADCGSGLRCLICKPTAGGLPQTRSRSCFPATVGAPNACTFDTWAACKQSGACGNGKVEGLEECDNGSGNSDSGTCLTNCKKNVCGDNHVLPGIEQCDNGAANGVKCTAQYGLTCNYCKTDCSIETVSGAFCGDKTITSPPESCDAGGVTAWCSRTYSNPSDNSHVKGCTSNNDCLPGVCKNYPGASFPPGTTSLAPVPAASSSMARLAFATADFMRDAVMVPIAYAATLNQLASFHIALGVNPPPPPDLTPPVITFTSPSAGSTGSGNVDVNFTVTDNSGGAITGTYTKPCGNPSTSPYSGGSPTGGSVTWNTALSGTACANGNQTFTVTAKDSSNNSSSATLTLNLQNPVPDTTITAGPAAGSTTGPTTSFTSSGSPSSGFIQCQIDGGAFSACGFTASLSGLTSGSHTFNVRASIDGTNYDATPATRTWTVDATPPVASFTAPAAGSSVSGTASISVTATDTGAPIAVAVAAPCGSVSPVSQAVASGATATFSWITGACANASQTLSLSASDNFGNAAATVTRAFVVNNPAPPPPDTTAPAIGSITVSPPAPITTDAVTLSVSGVTDAGSKVSVVKISLTSGGVKTLKQTCNFSPAQSPASCSINVGTLSAGAYVVTIDAKDGSGNDATPATLSFNVSPADTTPPSIGSIVVTPASPNTGSDVTISTPGVTDAGSKVSLIKISTTANSVTTQLKICAFSPTQSPASCSVDIGKQPLGTQTITVDATDGTGNHSTATQPFTVSDTSSSQMLIASPATQFVQAQPQGNAPPEGASCWSATDCAPSQYCQGGEGQCLSYNTRCVPEPYSNTQAAANSSRYVDGSCSSCSLACTGLSSKSPNYCGDTTVQPQFGEQCDGVGDPNATGHGTTYGCSGDCTFDQSAGYCGDGIIQPNTVEQCDSNIFPGGTVPSCASLGWGNAGAVSCSSSSCRLYGGGCVDGDLSPGDVRIKVEWTAGDATSDNDTHVILPTSAGVKNVGYAGTAGIGTVLADPHVWWSWDDTTGTKGAFTSAAPASKTYPNPHGLELMTANWRNGGHYWSSTATDPYKVYIYNYGEDGNNFKNMRVTVCTYKAGFPKNADCSKTYDGPTTSGPGPYWHVFDMFDQNQDTPAIHDVNQIGNCSCTNNCQANNCPAIGL